jgi:hypothetical protein
MTKARVLSVTAIVVILAAYVAGYWPEHRRATTAETENLQLREQLSRASAQNRLAEILGLSLRLGDALAINNFGEASTLASTYFDRLQQEAAKQSADAGATLARLLRDRDTITAALARTDAAAAAALRLHQIELRRALGYAVPDNSTPGERR